MKVNIGITEAHTSQAALQMSKLLADEFVLYTKTRNAHWNLQGNDFYGLHLFFEEQFQQLEKVTDDIAERIRSLGHYAPGSLKSMLELTQLSEHNPGSNSAREYIKLLLEDHLSIVFFLRMHIDVFTEKYKDFASADLLTQVMAIHEKMAWMLTSHLK